MAEHERCRFPMGTSEALSVTCALPMGHDGDHCSAFEHGGGTRLRGAVTDTARADGQGVDGGPVAPEPSHAECERYRWLLRELWEFTGRDRRFASVALQRGIREALDG